MSDQPVHSIIKTSGPGAFGDLSSIHCSEPVLPVKHEKDDEETPETPDSVE